MHEPFNLLHVSSLPRHAECRPGDLQGPARVGLRARGRTVSAAPGLAHRGRAGPCLDAASSLGQMAKAEALLVALGRSGNFAALRLEKGGDLLDLHRDLLQLSKPVRPVQVRGVRRDGAAPSWEVYGLDGGVGIA